MRAQLSFVLSQITRLTDRQTDGQTEFLSLDRVCIPYSAVKTKLFARAYGKHPQRPGDGLPLDVANTNYYY